MKPPPACGIFPVYELINIDIPKLVELYAIENSVLLAFADEVSLAKPAALRTCSIFQSS